MGWLDKKLTVKWGTHVGPLLLRQAPRRTHASYAGHVLYSYGAVYPDQDSLLNFCS